MSRTSTVQLSHLSQIAASQPLPVTACWAIAFATAVTLWAKRARTRKALATLTRKQLDDVQISPVEAFVESRKPFWKP